MSFVKILQVCYEPYVALAVIGLLACMLLRRWKIFISGILLLVAMISWRVSIAGEGSSRYGLAVLFPVMFFVLIAGSEIEKYITAKFSRVKKNTFTVIFCAVIVAFSFGKIFRLSQRNAVNIGEELKNNVAKDSVIICHANGYGQVLGYYANIPVVKKDEKYDLTVLRNEAFNYSNLFENVMILLKDLSLPGDEFDLIKSWPRDRKNRKQYKLYRVKKVTKTMPDEKGNLIRNGDFAKTRPFRKRKDRKIVNNTGNVPVGWYIDEFPQRSTFSMDVLPGKNGSALLLGGDATASACCDDFISVKKSFFEVGFRYKIIAGSLYIRVYEYDSEKKFIRFREIDSVNFMKQQACNYRYEFGFADKGISFFRMVFTTNKGSVLLSDIVVKEL